MNRIALFGYPLEYSLSPAMHNAAFRALGLNEWSYEIRPTSPGDLTVSVRDFFRAGGVAANVTIPHKQAIIKCVDELTETARLIGAVNTLSLRNARLIGDNTDGIGFMQALFDANVDPRGMSVVLFGAGGSARAVAFALASHQIRALTILNRHETRAERLARDLQKNFRGLTLDVAGADALARAQLIVNATPVGMAPGVDQSPFVNDMVVPRGAVVYDLIYHPSETKLLKTARAAGAFTLGGLGMLVHQGVAAFELWTGRAAPLEVMQRAVREADESNA